MSKAEERAKERYWLEPSNIDTHNKYQAYLEGYYQAQKDLALTWKDMRELHIIITEVDVEIELGMIDIKTETLDYYEEVLNRFNKQKEDGRVQNRT